MPNPLLEDHKLPPFKSIKAEHVVPAITTLLARNQKALDTQLAEGGPWTYESLQVPIEAREDLVDKAWSPVSHLNGVANSPELRQAYEAADKLLTEHYTDMGQNRALFEAYLEVKNSPDYENLTQPQKKVIDNAIRDFKLSGVGLEGDQKAAYKKIKAELSQLSTQFSNNILDATNGWYHHITDKSDLESLPEFLIEGAAKAAQDRDLEGYVLTLDLPVYMTVLTQSPNRELRELMYRAYTTRASQEGPTAGQWDNTEIIDHIMSLRQQRAKLLDFKNFAELSLATKMAEGPQHVIDFLQDLADKTRPFAERELDELKQFAREKFTMSELAAWDIPYISEQLKLDKYNVSQEILRAYFPLDVVQSGLFRVVEALYGIDVVESPAEKWHEDVKYFELQRNGETFASFYFDLYARAQKRGGAWMAECRVRRQVGDQQQLPVAYLTCNFNAPVNGKPCLLTHDDVTTLFHEFGHGLHHMLTKVDVAPVSGINGVEWDAVELPSQFMENFCWEPEVLNFLSSHHETGESLPKSLLDNMLNAKHFQSAMQMLRQLEFAIFDMRLHMESVDKNFPGVQALLDQVRDKVSVIKPPAFNKFQNGFSHVFAGGYAAGYYSYKWAEVLSADAFSAFEEEGILNPQTGQRFLKEILEQGGSQSAIVLFKNFRGREPSAEPLMRHSGLVA